jgi:hypothetical protein
VCWQRQSIYVLGTSIHLYHASRAGNRNENKTVEMSGPLASG